MEDIYGEKPSDNIRARDMPFSKSARFLGHQGHHQQLSLIPLLESGNHHIPNSQSRFCKDFMEKNFDEVCTLVLKQRSSSRSLVQHTLLTFLPQLAAFKPKDFVKTYVQFCEIYILRLTDMIFRPCIKRDISYTEPKITHHRKYLLLIAIFD